MTYSPVAFDPYAPYGELVESTLRVVTWNVWGRHGDSWKGRQAGIEQELLETEPDIVCLVEAWAQGDVTQPGLIAEATGLSHHVFLGGWEVEDWASGLGVVSRWPLGDPTRRSLRAEDGSGFGEAVHVVVDGPRGPIHLFLAALDYPLDGSATRQHQVRELCAFVREAGSRRSLTMLCGDFNAGPDSDEIRLLTGRSAPPVPGVVFYDSWEVAGDGSPGHTWCNQNPLAALGLYPDRRFDYVFSAWPRLGGVGHPVASRLLGVRPPGQPELSDHYGVVADLRY